MTDMSRSLGRRSFLRAGVLGAVGLHAAGRGHALAADPKSLDFTTFHVGADGGIMQGIVNRCNAAQAAAKVNFSSPAWGADSFTKLLTASLAGNPPPIVALHNEEFPPLTRFLFALDAAALGIKKENYVTMWVEQAEYAHFPPYHPRWTQAYRTLSEGMEAIAFRGADVKSTLREVTTGANDTFAQPQPGLCVNTCATLTPTLSLSEGEGAVSILSPPGGEGQSEGAHRRRNTRS